MALRWKVCGITRLEDAQAAVRAGADAVGFVFYEASPRNITPATAAAIAERLPTETWRVGVFVNRPAHEMAALIERVGLDFVQLSGDEPAAVADELPRHAFKALRLRPDDTGEQAQALADRYPECTLLVDAAAPGQYGGTGRTGNWAAAAHLARRHRLMLAGGLCADNVAQALEAVRPWALDVSSGVESTPGIKDHEKLAAFAHALEPYR